MATVKALFHSGAFDAEATHAMGVAYDKLSAEIGLKDGTDALNQIVAQRIIEAARTGERNPDKLCASAANALLGHET